MEMGDRFGEREAEPGSLVGAAGIKAAEPPHGLPVKLSRNTGPAITDGYADVAVRAVDGDLDLAAARSVADRIFDQVADRLGEQLAVTEQRQWVRGLGVVQARLDRAGAAADGPGDVFQRQPFEEAQQQHRAVLGREPLQGLVDEFRPVEGQLVR